MRTAFLLFIGSVLFFKTGASQSKLGNVVSVSITTTDIDSSVAVYEKLGFPQIASNTYPFPWAQVSISLFLPLRILDWIQKSGYSN